MLKSIIILKFFADFFKFFKCRLFNNNYRKLAKMFGNNEIIETNNWTRLLIFDDKINLYFLNMFLYMTPVIYCRTVSHFMSSLFNNFKKLILNCILSSTTLHSRSLPLSFENPLLLIRGKNEERKLFIFIKGTMSFVKYHCFN